MPDLRQPLRTLTASRLMARLTAHVAIVALLVATASFAVATSRSAPSSHGYGQAAGAISIVTAARGAADTVEPGRSASFELQPDPLRDDPMLVRKAAPSQPPTPAATPVAPPPAPEQQQAAQAAPAPPVVATATRTGSLLWPVPGGVITQYYHAGHLALDIAAPYGSRVVAADNGVVIWAGWRNNGGGYVVEIDHGNGFHTAYNHLSSIWVSVGQRVTRGTAIAAVGCTGDCTGPHCHFEVKVGGIFVNPLRYL